MAELMDGAQPYQIWSADKWACESCGFEVLSGFGALPVAEHFQDSYAQWASPNSKGESPVRFWNTAKDKDAGGPL
jgi:hypothetical protein